MSSAPIDVSKLTPEEKSFYDKYGRLPPAKKNVIGHQMKDRKYFDSGDYALSKAGKSNPKEVGSQHPSPERIPHSIPQSLKKNDGVATNSPVKESGLVHQSDATADP
ncbi:camp-regulated phosphoprotein/endosulfine conserved region-domain-containing protein [Polychytrium aggregatum]|uniref:camp-regulated phosphoprotein/endosulfine conserved region-domain-containing protein n=1 Tax=Polychytrium aggregatum TaxID=110093 RepID=UPI0022FE3D30|nr:camp-regulated phosphoprotein/endosulfine conserved region-domain-containing protein [Polychytrium aggregatum]KAI9209338.1 camp-regulated phosphoprotein/endosulfine conserved region-domain-containing protein [Polychytrium aggregatum]